MTDDTHTTADTKEFLTSRETISATIERDGDEYPLKVRDITRDELTELEERAGDGPEAEEQVIREAIGEYLIEPDVDPDSVPTQKLSLLFGHLMRAWSGADEVGDAMDDLQIQGNRR